MRNRFVRSRSGKVECAVIFHIDREAAQDVGVAADARDAHRAAAADGEDFGRAALADGERAVDAKLRAVDDVQGRARRRAAVSSDVEFAAGGIGNEAQDALQIEGRRVDRSAADGMARQIQRDALSGRDHERDVAGHGGDVVRQGDGIAVLRVCQLNDQPVPGRSGAQGQAVDLLKNGFLAERRFGGAEQDRAFVVDGDQRSARLIDQISVTAA